jgi:hypothetical protein
VKSKKTSVVGIERGYDAMLAEVVRLGHDAR